MDNTIKQVQLVNDHMQRWTEIRQSIQLPSQFFHLAPSPGAADKLQNKQQLRYHPPIYSWQTILKFTQDLLHAWSNHPCSECSHFWARSKNTAEGGNQINHPTFTPWGASATQHLPVLLYLLSCLFAGKEQNQKPNKPMVPKRS